MYSSSILVTENYDSEYIYQISSETTESELVLYEGRRNGKLTKENIISKAFDDDGISYYYRGDVINNYLNFADMCWRIVRIEGDGSVKLVLEDSSPCSSDMDSDFSIGNVHFGHQYKPVINSNGQSSSKSYYLADYLGSTIGMKSTLDNWFNDSFSIENKNKLKSDKWCFGDKIKAYDYKGNLLEGTTRDIMYNNTSFYFENAKNLKGLGGSANTTLKCSGDSYTSKIGALTANEVAFAGSVEDNKYYYDEYINMNYYLQNSNYNWFTLSFGNFSRNTSGSYSWENDSETIYRVTEYGDLMANGVYSACANSMPTCQRSDVRPAITLVKGIGISGGNGSVNNPYIVN